MKPATYIYLLTCIIAAAFGCAQKNTQDISVTDAWIRATHSGQQTGAAYFVINSQKNAALVKVESPVAQHAEIHSMEMKDGVMLMREMESLALPENQPVQLAPGGHHIMLMDLKQAMQSGEKVPLTLHIKRGNESVVLTLQADVRKN